MAKTDKVNGESSRINTPQAEGAEERGFFRGVISIFILFHLIAIACWALPFNISPFKNVKALVIPYMRWSGLFQSWDFFAPNPIGIDSSVEAVVITQNHHQLVWAFPRMEQLSYGERYRKERYRKFSEVLTDPKNSDLWPDVAKHVAGMFDNPDDPPQAVLLIQFQSPIGSHLAPKPNIFYEYVVDFPSGDTE